MSGVQCGVQWRGGAGEPSVCRADPALELLPSQTSCQIQFTVSWGTGFPTFAFLQHSVVRNTINS